MRGPCSDWRLVSFTMNMIFKVWPTAYAKLAVQHRQRQARGVQLATEPDIMQNPRWHELEGNRCAYVGAGLFQATVVSATSLCIVMEPSRMLRKWFLRRASTLRRAVAQNRLRPLPPCDLDWTYTSPAFRALQYLSGLLLGRRSRLKLLRGRTHHTSGA